MDVFLVILGGDKLQPSPNGPLPSPELYASVILGAMSPLDEHVGIGKDNVAVPVAGFTSKFSPMPPMDPPPFGKEIDGVDPGESF